MHSEEYRVRCFGRMKDDVLDSLKEAAERIIDHAPLITEKNYAALRDISTELESIMARLESLEA